MKNSSLEKATQLILDVLEDTTKIDEIDKLELLINIPKFLEPKQYRENVKTLEKRRTHGKNK